jgi:hypothetical protein
VQAGFDAAVMQTFAGAVPHAAFGRLRIRHISTLNYNFRARNDTARKSIVNREAGAIPEPKSTPVPRPFRQIEYEHWSC